MVATKQRRYQKSYRANPLGSRALGGAVPSFSGGRRMKRGMRLLVSLTASLLILSLFASIASGSDCFTDCIIRYDCDTSHPWGGSSCYDLCTDACKEEAWAAIAYSWKDKTSGWSFAQYDEATAKRIARQACAKEGGANCIVQTSFYNACGAVAADGDLVAWGRETTIGKARQRALMECAKIGGTKCVVQAWSVQIRMRQQAPVRRPHRPRGPYRGAPSLTAAGIWAPAGRMAKAGFSDRT